MVTPFAGVWIEIILPSKNSTVTLSLPLRECGLKWVRRESERERDWSLPLRECGLKLSYVVDDSGNIGHSLCGSVD